MRRAHLWSLLVSFVLVISTSGCNTPSAAEQPTKVAAQTASLAQVPETTAEPTDEPAPAPPPTATTAKTLPSKTEEPSDEATTTETTTESDTDAVPGGYGVPNEDLEIDSDNFDRSEIIDNKWFPLKPGTQLVYEGTTEENGEVIPHRVIFTVTDLVKVINGIRVAVILDSDYTNDVMEELELTYFAQDKNGDVWHLGQYRETYADEFVGGRVWFVDAPKGARAGIMMHANPQLGTDSYSEGYAPPPFHWTDRGRVFQVGQKTSVVSGNYDDVLVIEETDSEHPEAGQLKYYAQGVGIVRVGWSRSDETKESMELIERVELDSNEMEEIRQTALELEERAYMYCATAPAEPVSR